MTTEAMRALDEIETQLTGADGWLTKIEGDDREQMMALGHHNVKQALRLLPTLRAALAAPGDGEIEAIRARAVTWPGGLDPNSALTPFGEACNDRATLLDRDARHVAEIARLSAELAAERVRRVEVEGRVNELNELRLWAYETLMEINISNYDHDDVCRLNAASVEVMLGLNSVSLAARATLTKD